MLSENTLPLLILSAVVVLVILVALMFLARRRLSVDETSPSAMKAVSEARIEQGEYRASLIGEQIEEMVRERLAKDPATEKVAFDFGTAEDGSLEIWIAGKRYVSVAEIPDERIRAAVEQAVEEFNR
jgi:hypothetical protein